MSRPVTKVLLKNCESVSELLKSLAHPVRLKILCQLMEQPRNVGELTEFCDISQSAMSQFLSRMKNEGILISERKHNFVYYRVAEEKVVQLLKAIKEIYCDS